MPFAVPAWHETSHYPPSRGLALLILDGGMIDLVITSFKARTAEARIIDQEHTAQLSSPALVSIQHLDNEPEATIT
jgi:hypothetical protein